MIDIKQENKSSFSRSFEGDPQEMKNKIYVHLFLSNFHSVHKESNTMKVLYLKSDLPLTHSNN